MNRAIKRKKNRLKLIRFSPTALFFFSLIPPQNVSSSPCSISFSSFAHFTSIVFKVRNVFFESSCDMEMRANGVSLLFADNNRFGGILESLSMQLSNDNFVEYSFYGLVSVLFLCVCVLISLSRKLCSRTSRTFDVLCKSKLSFMFILLHRFSPKRTSIRVFFFCSLLFFLNFKS